MTLISFVCDGDHAEILTDSLSYLRNLGKLGTTTKLNVLAHFDAAVMTQGDGTFGGHVRSMANTSVGLLEDPSFDGLVREIQPALQDFWQWTLEAAPSPDLVYDSTVYLVGYSLDAGEFVSYQFASDHGFEPERITGPYATPMPGAYRITPLECERLRRAYTDAPNIDELLGHWAEQPELPAVPYRNLEAWVRLGLKVRYSRTLEGDLTTLVGGSLYLTALEQGLSISTNIFDFDDTGDELLAMVGYSQHPVAQSRPCWCDSGKRHLDCHLAEFVDQPCGCGCSKLFRDCCMIHD